MLYTFLFFFMDDDELIGYLFKEDAVNQIFDFLDLYGGLEDDWPNEQFWTDLDELVKGLAEISMQRFQKQIIKLVYTN
ncbi:MAG TPA: hypothetical protein GXX68_04425 [Defluviitoga tunisiensis]|nr:hypothetical protein [Defluviitoga tunisiensis]